MSYVFQLEDAKRYDQWYLSEPGRSAVAVEKELLLRLWSPSTPQTVLEVGCGTGLFLEWFAQQGHQVTGLDPSPHMLDLCRRRSPARTALDQGYAEHLPYDDNAFDTVALITTLEFVDDPVLALQEALRVARRHVLLGALNKYSLATIQRYVERLWKRSVYWHARFFSVYELQHMVYRALSGPVPVRWRTCLSLPLNTLRYLRFLERSPYFQWHPFGHFIAMRIDPCFILRVIQQPLFCKLPSGVGSARLYGSIWRIPGGDNGPDPIARRNGAEGPSGA